eukprot:s44_g9.t1
MNIDAGYTNLRRRTSQDPAGVSSHCFAGLMEEVLRVQRTEDGRGQSTVALKDFEAGEVLLREPCLAVAFEAAEKPWAAELRRRLKAMDGTCAWQYCLAVRCLSQDDPVPWEDFEGLEPLSAEAVRNLEVRYVRALV